MKVWRIAAAALAWIALLGLPGIAEENSSSTCVSRAASMAEAWWTGPMLAPSAATLPKGHILIEPYLYDVRVQGQYDSKGNSRSAPESNGFGSLTYINYGLMDRVTVGLIPTFGYNRVSDGPNSSGVQVGDVTVQAQYRLAQFHPCHWMPTTSIAVQESLPSGKYDRLGTHLSNGLGGGAYITTVALYSQMYFWLLNERILRMRFNVAESLAGSVDVKDASVYGTQTGFHGRADPGNSTFIDASGEYSITQRWVLALDATYRYQANTPVSGFSDAAGRRTPIELNSGSSGAFALAPAIEYSWKPSIGVLIGTRLLPAGRNTPATVTPAIAINFVH